VIGVSVLALFGGDTKNAVVVVHGVAATGVWVEIHPAGSAGATTPSKFWMSGFGGRLQTSFTVHAFPSSHSLVLFA
jgi:hypothetical protein